MADFIFRQAHELGLSAIGFAEIAPTSGFKQYQAWLDAGFAAGMDYLFRGAPARKDPRVLLPEARTLISAAISYPGRSTNPFYSSHAQCRDYHKTLVEALRELAERANSLAGAAFKYRVCADAHPILEREWACRAGLGWIGKQGSLVHPSLGCRLFLGEILTELELPPSQPVTNQCGNCRCCIEACPNAAFAPEGFLDARRCLSYLTIEHRGPMPNHAFTPNSYSLFGCDTCTSVCPYNPADENNVSPLLRQLPESKQWPTPKECLALDKPGFDRIFSGTTIERLGLERLQRNAKALLNCPSDSSACQFRDLETGSFNYCQIRGISLPTCGKIPVSEH